MSKEQLINFLNENNYFDTVYEEYDFFETLFCESIWTTFEFEFDRLRCIEFSPLYKNDDEIIWPIEQ